ncbi:MAG TPA: hypothetical protein VK630_04270 [Reyranella sp.]|nr:hypothetical protein [Reyranella sp.]
MPEISHDAAAAQDAAFLEDLTTIATLSEGEPWESIAWQLAAHVATSLLHVTPLRIFKAAARPAG